MGCIVNNHLRYTTNNKYSLQKHEIQQFAHPSFKYAKLLWDDNDQLNDQDCQGHLVQTHSFLDWYNEESITHRKVNSTFLPPLDAYDHHQHNSSFNQKIIGQHKKEKIKNGISLDEKDPYDIEVDAHKHQCTWFMRRTKRYPDSNDPIKNCEMMRAKEDWSFLSCSFLFILCFSYFALTVQTIVDHVIPDEEGKIARHRKIEKAIGQIIRTYLKEKANKAERDKDVKTAIVGHEWKKRVSQLRRNTTTTISTDFQRKSHLLKQKDEGGKNRRRLKKNKTLF